MKLVAAIKLVPNRGQARALKETLERCNAACSWLAAEGLKAGTFRQFDLHKMAYAVLRADPFGLTAQVAIRSIAKVADAFKISRERAPIFRRLAAQPYDDRILSFKNNGAAVSLWTFEGRIIVPVVMGEHQRALMAYRKGEVDLCFVRGKWLLACTVDIPETEEFRAADWLGIDFGIVNIATDSDGRSHSGDAIEALRRKMAHRKAGLQRCGTKAAKRRLKKLAGRQARFQKHVNHEISKKIVETAERTSRGIALEDLTHIRRRVTARRGQRSRLHNWSFRQLRAFVSYKAKRVGVPTLAVDPRHTSIGCSCCGSVDNRNRPKQAIFSCVGCGYSAPADFNAAQNLRAKAARAPVTAPLRSALNATA